MTFKKWLLQQAHRADPVGDLARDCSCDKNLEGESRRAIQCYLIRIGACDAAMDSFVAAGEEYKSMSRQQQDNHAPDQQDHDPQQQ